MKKHTLFSERQSISVSSCEGDTQLTHDMQHNILYTSRRQLLAAGALMTSGLLQSTSVSAQTIASNSAMPLAARIWPSDAYTRITLEYSQGLKFSHFFLANPKRLVLDVEGLAINDVLRSLSEKVSEADPYVQQIRVAPNRPNVTRLVFELKDDVRPDIFALKPMASYQHRLVIDLYGQQADIQTAKRTQKNSAPMPAPIESAKNSSPIVGDDKSEDSLSQDIATPEVIQVKNSGKQYRNTKGRSSKRMITIALDPGHGGEDPGAVGPSGLYEKTVVLQIARKVRQKLLQLPNVQVVMTRDADFFVPLNVRVQKARRARADLFMSIHADAFIRPEANGSSVFALSERGASSSAARWLANKENNADLIGGVNVASKDAHIARVLMDMSMSAQIRDSIKLGSALLKHLGHINRLHNNNVEQASFAVLKAPDIPSVLVETAFISNPAEEAKLRQEGYQDQMAHAIVEGIQRYLANNPPVARKIV